MEETAISIFDDTPQNILLAIWMVWAAVWVLMAGFSSRPAERAGFLSQAPYMVVTIIGFFLLFSIDGVSTSRGPHALSFSASFSLKLWALPESAAWVMVGVGLFGAVFAFWARLTMGNLWSGSVQRKEGHRVVDKGPFGIVRHPIYTGLILGAGAMAAIKGFSISLAGFVLIILGFWMKARLEEKLLIASLGEEYLNYRKRVPMLFPWPKGRR
ncbi:MAG TPA: isoprenylcysteine carboxylmethyltransferase family protein [Parvularculaceae bacterium]|nr:isoprenylcysteine carboxylmethyltransferase family protein [Parvularculaceae bacterium]